MIRLLLVTTLFLSPLVCTPAWADDPLVYSSLAEIPKADGKAIEGLLEKFFGPFTDAGPDAAVASIKDDAPFDLSPLVPQFHRLTELSWAGPPEAYEVIKVMPLGTLGRFQEVRVVSYHKHGVAGWRFKFYKTATNTWVFSAMELQSSYVRELMDMYELEYDSLRE